MTNDQLLFVSFAQVPHCIYTAYKIYCPVIVNVSPRKQTGRYVLILLGICIHCFQSVIPYVKSTCETAGNDESLERGLATDSFNKQRKREREREKYGSNSVYF